MKSATAMCAIMLATSVGFGQSPQLDSTLSEFTFEQIPLGATVEQVSKRFPSLIANPDRTEKEFGLASYFVRQATPVFDFEFQFVDGRLYSITGISDRNRVSKIGGINTMYNRLKERLGDDGTVESVDDGERVVWESESAGRRLVLISLKNLSGVAITDMKIDRLLTERRAKTARLGF